MNITVEELFTIIGKQAVNLIVLQAEVDRLREFEPVPVRKPVSEETLDGIVKAFE